MAFLVSHWLAEDTEHAQNDLAPGDAEVNVELLQDALAEVQLQKSAQETAAETKPGESDEVTRHGQRAFLHLDKNRRKFDLGLSPNNDEDAFMTP